jgi:serum/glucocorticoid-regulated kinase 2
LIQKADLRIPGYISYDARDLLKKLLKHSPAERLGTGDGDMHDIMAHAFFKDLDFDALMRREIRPEFQPTVKSATDTSNFDAEFTDEQVVDSMAPTSRLIEAKANQFNDFTYKDKAPLG